MYGVWPALGLGVAATAFYHYHRMKNVLKFQDPNIDRTRLKKVYKFSSAGESWHIISAIRCLKYRGARLSYFSCLQNYSMKHSLLNINLCMSI